MTRPTNAASERATAPARHTVNLDPRDALRPAREWLASLPWDRARESLETMNAEQLLRML